MTRFADVSAFPMPVPDPPHLRTVRLSIRTEPEDTWDPHGRRQYDSRSRVRHRLVCRWRAPAAASQADRAPRGAIIVMTGSTRGLPVITYTWLAVPLLKPPPFRQASSRLGPNSGILVDFGGAKRVVKPQETTPGGADRRKTVTTGPPHGPGDSLSSPP